MVALLVACVGVCLGLPGCSGSDGERFHGLVRDASRLLALLGAVCVLTAAAFAVFLLPRSRGSTGPASQGVRASLRLAAVSATMCALSWTSMWTMDLMEYGNAAWEGVALCVLAVSFPLAGIAWLLTVATTIPTRGAPELTRRSAVLATATCLVSAVPFSVSAIILWIFLRG
jgi:hypothetical protein